MLVYITTTQQGWAAEIPGDDPARAVQEVGTKIKAREVLDAGIAQGKAGVGEICRIVFNPDHVVSVHTLA